MGLAAGLLVSFRLFGGLIELPVSSTILNAFFVDNIGHLGPLSGELAALGDVREHRVIPLLGQVKVALELLRGLIEAYRRSIF